MGFDRRFPFFPGTQVIIQIEGNVIVRLSPPSVPAGVAEGIVGLVAEFADMTYGIAVSTAGRISAKPVPVQILGSTDLLQKTGNFDELIGNFGTAMGNGFVSLRNKSFSGLVVVAVDMLSPSTAGEFSSGCRFWRQLPTCASATNPNPIVPVSAASLLSGGIATQFQDGSGNRVRLASAFSFGGQAAYETGTDGAVTHVGSTAASQTFTSAGGNFVQGVKAGDLLVLGVIGDATHGSNAATYRVVSVTDATDLVVERLDGSVFDWTSETSAPWRLHVAAAGDSSGVAGLHLALVQTGGAGYLIPCRPLDASIAIDAALTPTIAPPAGTGTSWDPLSGLTGRANHITGDAGGNHAIVYDALLHAANVGNSATIDARYQAAIASFLQILPPASTIDIVLASRKSATIRTALATHTNQARAQMLTRRAIFAPELSVQSTQAAIATTSPGVGALRSEAYDYSWPFCTTSIPEAVGFNLAGADGSIVNNGILDVPFDEWLAAIESNLPPENNPGQAAPPVPQVLTPVLGLGRGVPSLAMQDYIALRAAGIAGLVMDPISGPQIESGVTTNISGGTPEPISQCRMADFIEDSLNIALKPFGKLNQTTQLIDTELGEIIAFLEGLKSTNNPPAQRIVNYSVDPNSGNTPALTAAGVTVFIINVQLLASQNNLVLQTNIGAGVQITNITP